MDFEAIEQGGRHMIDRLSDAKEPGTCRHATSACRLPSMEST